MSKSRCDLDLDRTMPNIELVRAIFIYYNVLKFKSTEPSFFELSCTQTHTERERHQGRQTDRHTDTQTDMSTL